MEGLDYVTLELHKFLGTWIYSLRWRVADERPTPHWSSIQHIHLQRDYGSLQELLEDLAEDLFNLAPLTTNPAGARRPAGPVRGPQ